MAPAEKELEDQLMDAGNRLLNPPYAVDELLPLLNHVENCLSRVEQSPSQSMLDALQPSTKALIAKELLRHSDTDVKVAVASCISEITRITAPEAPYDDELMKEIFQMIVAAFEKLYDMSSPSYAKRVSILETVGKVRSCVVMLDLECDDLILEMFNHFLKAIRETHPDNIFSSMETIMSLVLEESEDISSELLYSLLSCVKKENQGMLPTARRLGEKVIGNCAAKIKPYLLQEVRSLSIAFDDYSEIVASICQDTFGAQEHNNLNAGQQLAEESKLSETTGSEGPPQAEESKLSETSGSEGPPQGGDKMEAEVACPGEVDPTMDKSPAAVMSNGIVLGHKGNSLEPNSPLKKLDLSSFSHISETTVATTEGEPDHLEPSKSAQPETIQDQATKKTGSQKTNSLTHSTDTSDHSGMECKKAAMELSSTKRGRSKETDSSVSEGPSIKEAGPSEDEKKTGFSSPTGSHNETTGTASSVPSQSLPEATRRKRGRPFTKKKEVANAEVDLHVSPPGQMETISSDHVVDEACPSTDINQKKESEGNSDTEAKTHRRSTKKVGAGSANMDENLPTTDNNLKKESEGTSDSEMKPLRRSGKKVHEGNTTEGESSVKQKDEQPKQRKGTPRTEKEVTREMRKKKMVSSPKSATKVSIKGESQLEEIPKTELKRKRPSTEKALKNLQAKDLGEDIVGRKIMVWWPTDKMFYNGIVSLYDSDRKKHEIVYEDGDVERLLLKNERWEFISNAPDEEKSSELPSPHTSDMLPKKRMKTSSESSTKRARLDSASKRGKGASGEKSKVDGTKTVHKAAAAADDDAFKSRSKSKSDTIKLGSKAKEGTPKTGSKSKDDTTSDAIKLGSKTKEGTRKSKDNTTSKPKDDSPKTARKAKEETPSKSKDDGTPKAGSKSMDDTAKTSNKANGTPGKGKSGSLKVKVGKGKSVSTMAQESDTKSGKKIAQESETKSGKKPVRGGESRGGKKIVQENETMSGKQRRRKQRS